MKTHFFTVLLSATFFFATALRAQDEKPRDFLLVPQSGAVTLAANGTAQVQLNIKRAGFFRKNVIKLKANHDAKGIEVSFDNADALGETAMVTLKTNGATPGTYGVTLTGSTVTVTRGTTLQVTVQ